MKQVREKGQELLVEQVMAASTNGTEECPEKQEVVVGFLGRLGELHGAVHYLVEVWLRKQGPSY